MDTSCFNSLLRAGLADAVQRSPELLEHIDDNMSIKSSHKDLEGSCISLDQDLSMAEH